MGITMPSIVAVRVMSVEIQVILDVRKDPSDSVVVAVIGQIHVFDSKYSGGYGEKKTSGSVSGGKRGQGNQNEPSSFRGHGGKMNPLCSRGRGGYGTPSESVGQG